MTPPDAPTDADDPPRLVSGSKAGSVTGDDDEVTKVEPEPGRGHNGAGDIPIVAPVDAPPSTAGSGKGKRIQRMVLEWVVLIGAALAIAFLIKTLLFQAFYIPSESMTPTLRVGDRVLVNKLSYDLHDVNRGDIVVFEAPARARSAEIEDLVKRVIGLPGDTVEFREGDVYIGGRRLKEPYLDPATKETSPLQQNVPDGCDAPASGQPGCVVPAGHIFVMGDNRVASKDGRAFGPIAESTIVGRVFLRIWPLDDISFL